MRKILVIICSVVIRYLEFECSLFRGYQFPKATDPLYILWRMARMRDLKSYIR